MPTRPYEWHPIAVHFTVGLFAACVLFFVLARIVKRPQWRPMLIAAAELNLWLGVPITVVTALLGWVAVDTAPGEEAVHALVARHHSLGLATLAAFGAMLVLSFAQRRKESYPSLLFLAGLVVSLGLLVATGMLGGQLVYEHGLGMETRASQAR